jgi:hypothetical protein
MGALPVDYEVDDRINVFGDCALNEAENMARGDRSTVIEDARS